MSSLYPLGSGEGKRDNQELQQETARGIGMGSLGDSTGHGLERGLRNGYDLDEGHPGLCQGPYLVESREHVYIPDHMTTSNVARDHTLGPSYLSNTLVNVVHNSAQYFIGYEIPNPIDLSGWDLVRQPGSSQVFPHGDVAFGGFPLQTTPRRTEIQTAHRNLHFTSPNSTEDMLIYHPVIIADSGVRVSPFPIATDVPNTGHFAGTSSGNVQYIEPVANELLYGGWDPTSMRTLSNAPHQMDQFSLTPTQAVQTLIDENTIFPQTFPDSLPAPMTYIHTPGQQTLPMAQPSIYHWNDHPYPGLGTIYWGDTTRMSMDELFLNYGLEHGNPDGNW